MDLSAVNDWIKVIGAAVAGASGAAGVIGLTVRRMIRGVVRDEIAPVRERVNCVAESVETHLNYNGRESEADPEDRYQPMRVLVMRTATRVREHGKRLEDGQRWMQAHEAKHQGLAEGAQRGLDDGRRWQRTHEAAHQADGDRRGE